MRIFKINMLFFMMITILLCCSSQAQAAQDGDHTYTVTEGQAQNRDYTGAEVVVSGKVLKPDGSLYQPDEDHWADISLQNLTDGREWRTATNGDGSYGFVENFPNGKYKLSAMPRGQYGGSIPMDIEIKDATPASANLTLTEMVITGKVLEPDGTVFIIGESCDPDAGVQLSKVVDNQEEYVCHANIARDGSYSLGGDIPSGTYRLRANTWGQNSLYASAIPVTILVTAGQKITRNIRLTNPVISGKVRQPEGSVFIPGNNAYVYVKIRRQDNSGDDICGTGVNNDGSFKLGGVPEGDYLLIADANGSNNPYANSIPVIIHIIAGQTINCDIYLTNFVLGSFDVENKEDGPSVPINAGDDFWTSVNIEQNDHRGVTMPPLSHLASFQGSIVYDPERLELLEVVPGELIPASGWTLQQGPPGAEGVYVELTGPQGDTVGLSGYGKLLRVHFRALSGAGGGGIFALKGGRIIEPYEEAQPFAFGGYLKNINGQDMPVISDRPPILGISSHVEIIPSGVKITEANPQRQTIAVSFDQNTMDAWKYPDVDKMRGSIYLKKNEGEWTVLKKDIFDGEVCFGWAESNKLVLSLGHGFSFAPGDSLRLKLEENAQTTDSHVNVLDPVETPLFIVPQILGKPLDLGQWEDMIKFGVEGINLSYQGKEPDSYSSTAPPTVKVSFDGYGPVAWDIVLRAPNGNIVGFWPYGPSKSREQEIPIDPTWESGNYKLLVKAFWLFDPTDTTMAFAIVPLNIHTVMTGLTATGVSKSQINLKWTAVSGATKYIIYRAVSRTGTYNYVGSSTTNAYSNPRLIANTTYWYKVSAVDSTGKGQKSVAVSGKTLAASSIAAPTGLTATGVSKSQINLKWTAVSGAAKYIIYRAVSRTGTYSYVGSSTTNAYANPGLGANTTYWYKVSAVDSTGEGQKSAAVRGKTLATSSIAAPAGLTATGVSKS